MYWSCAMDILHVPVINCASCKCIGHVPWIYYMYLSYTVSCILDTILWIYYVYLSYTVSCIVSWYYRVIPTLTASSGISQQMKTTFCQSMFTCYKCTLYWSCTVDILCVFHYIFHWNITKAPMPVTLELIELVPS